MSLALLWMRRLAIGLAVLLVLSTIALVVYQRFSDGPTGPLTGGPFKSGELTSTPVEDWPQLAGSFEFELVAQGSSRTAGAILLDDRVYLTCDLGFIWARLDPGMQRNLLQLIWWFKNWHEKALLDGRVRIRKDGKIYPANIVRVEDPRLIAQLKDAIEESAKEFFTDGLGPRPTQPPNDIWFFSIQ